MVNSNQDSSILGGQISVPIGDEEHTADHHPMEIVVSNTQNQPESTTITTVNADQDSSSFCGQVAISAEDEEHTPDCQTTEFKNYRGILYLLYVGFLVVMYPSLTQLLQLKFQNKKQSPFEVQCFFANTAVVAFTIAIPISLVLFYVRTRHETSITEHFYPIYEVYMILKSVFCFLVIIAPLALVLMLLLPHKLNWIGYLIILILFIVIAACNVSYYNKILRKTT